MSTSEDDLKPLFIVAVKRIVESCNSCEPVNDAILNSMKVCGDQSVGIVGKVCRKGLKDFPERGVKWINDTPYKPDSSIKRLVLILESPHVHEFDVNGDAKGPAKHQTGVAIRCYLEDILGPSISDLKDRELILVNAVQFQCSLGRDMSRETCKGRINRHIKNCIFDELIRMREFRVNLKYRMGLVFRPNSDDLIVNAVSIGTSTSCCVSRIVSELTGECSCGIGHPSGWCKTKENAKRIASQNAVYCSRRSTEDK